MASEIFHNGDRTTKILHQDESSTSFRAGWFNIQIGQRQEFIKDQKQLSISENFSKTISQYTTKVIIKETMDGPEEFTIEVIDQEMRFMFDENLYLGRHIFVDIGYWQGKKLNAKQACEGFINDMNYEFPDNGIPKLTIRGFGLVWDVMDKEDYAFHITFDPDKPSDKELSEHGRYNNITDLLKLISEKFDLRVDEGRTVPIKLEPKLYSTVDGKDSPPKEIRTQNPGGRKTWHGYLTWLSEQTGCWYFQKARYIHFMPPAMIEAPMLGKQQAAEYKANLEAQKAGMLEGGSPTPGSAEEKTIQDIDAQISMYDTHIREAGLYDQTGLIEAEGGYELHYKIGKKNLFSFKPKLTDLKVSGYMAMAMNPQTGEITFGNTVQTSDDATVGKENLRKWSDGTGIYRSTTEGKTRDHILESYKVPVDIATDTQRLDYANNTEKILPDPEEEKRRVARMRIAKAQGPQSQWVTQGSVEANFRERMWFADAEATCKGDIDLTCAIPVWIRGIGYKTDSEKLAGKWYVFSCTHTLVSGQDYKCDLTLKRYWQYPRPFSRENDNSDKGAKEMVARMQYDGRNGNKVGIKILKRQPPTPGGPTPQK